VNLRGNINIGERAFFIKPRDKWITLPLNIENNDTLRATECTIIPQRHEGFVPVQAISQNVFVERTHPTLERKGCFIAQGELVRDSPCCEVLCINTSSRDLCIQPGDAIAIVDGQGAILNSH
jgi:hypothetical protein